MKKNLLITISLVLICFCSSAQVKNEVSILYLLPFHLQENNPKISNVKSSAEIYQIKQFEMIGFWLGAKMALQEYESSGKKINVILRDAVKDNSSLYRIFDDVSLMKDVDIIIGPFYGSIFPEAAEYAKNNNIIIINPFSTRYDFVQNNSNVYKLTPPFYSRPETIAALFLSQPDDYHIILWGDSVQGPEIQAYKHFFNEHNIHFKEIHTFSLPLNAKKNNLIITLFEKTTRVIHAVHTLVNNSTPENSIVIVPEKWFSISELNDDFYNLPHLYYFTDYFIDENCSKVKQFQNDYLYFFHAPVELAGFAYQGYDITHYFIDLYFADFDISKVKYTPLSYQFKWNKILEGGFENRKTRLIQIKNLELEEVKKNEN
jgi:hypothetical protein